MKKQFVITKFLSEAFNQELAQAASPYSGNVYPILSTLKALEAPPLNCKTVVFEREYVDKDYQDEYAAFYSKSFKKYPSRAVRLHFFSAALSDGDLQRIDAFSKNYLGFLILRPTDLQRVGRTILQPTLTNADTEFIHCRASFPASILGHTLTVTGIPFIQQDSQVGACAQAALWMLARYMGKRFGHREFLPAEINHLAKAKGALGRALPAEFGLTVEQMLNALEGMGFSAISYSRYTLDDCSRHIDAAFPVDPQASDAEKTKQIELAQLVKLADIAYRYIESGLPVVFGTCDHALIGIGHTYDHSLPATAAIQRIPGFIVHNDNVGPYQGMPIFSPSTNQLRFDQVQDIIAVVPPEVTLRGEEAESMSRQAIANFLKLPTGDPKLPAFKDLIHLVRPDFVGALDKLEYRTFIMPSVEFQHKLRCDAIEKRFDSSLAVRLIELDYPKYIWVTEVSSSELLNHPRREDRKCLGRVIIDTTAPSRTRGEMVVHFADFLGLLDRQTGQPQPWEFVPKTTSFGHQISR